ncbi:S10 family peptidase [Yeosuana marina]|uniref:S10 family peptidase n=1 Tax=Yeosuana marina TaxID=1565536 RepID=UPI0030EBFC63|tara:strand:- start:2858 stop:4342 length:1485 start_codon:yes stop_codon:yes gene_type:complete
MKKILLFVFIISVCSAFSQNIKIPADTAVTTSHTITIKNQIISYKATAGTQPVWNKKGEPIATLFYTYYERDKTDKKNRPIIFSFNGGPGSASAWMHIAYTGPKVLNIDDEGYPIQPYGVKDNPNSILDVADIVYINPVNTGYSRMIADKDSKLPERETFFGINADIKYLAEWMNTFVTRKNRWESPKYIIGESYGGTRVMGLANELQNNQWMYLNGVIMVSPADYKLYNTNQPVYSALNLPYFTATAWHHKALTPDLQNKDLLEILPEVEDYALNKLMPALAKGGFISESEKQDVSKKMAYYSGLSQTAILQNNLNVSTSFFWKELLRDKTGETIGRLDSRYLGIDKTEAGDSPDFNPELTSWLHSFTPAINYYIRDYLKFKTDIKYNMFGDVHPWDNRNDTTRDRLRQAMAENPYLKVLIQSGYYDGATTYFGAKYTMHQIDPSGKMKDRFTFKGYRSGHMMYIRHDDLIKATNDLREFIKNSLSKGKAAKY